MRDWENVVYNVDYFLLAKVGVVLSFWYFSLFSIIRVYF